MLPLLPGEGQQGEVLADAPYFDSAQYDKLSEKKPSKLMFEGLHLFSTI